KWLIVAGMWVQAAGIGVVVVAITFVGFLSKVYELLEWSFAIALSPEAAEAYNGQQGDIWDAQKDAALAMVGAIIAMTLAAQSSKGAAPADAVQPAASASDSRATYTASAAPPIRAAVYLPVGSWVSHWPVLPCTSLFIGARVLSTPARSHG
ncbi:DUF2238 domain-containing protein, partial [bacterium]|nr:DUF2238 domain-containing protein [bacterium]